MHCSSDVANKQRTSPGLLNTKDCASQLEPHKRLGRSELSITKGKLMLHSLCSAIYNAVVRNCMRRGDVEKAGRDSSAFFSFRPKSKRKLSFVQTCLAFEPNQKLNLRFEAGNTGPSSKPIRCASSLDAAHTTRCTPDHSVPPMHMAHGSQDVYSSRNLPISVLGW